MMRNYADCLLRPQSFWAGYVALDIFRQRLVKVKAGCKGAIAVRVGQNETEGLWNLMITVDLNSRWKTKRSYVALKRKAWSSDLRIVVKDSWPELGFQEIRLLVIHYSILFGAQLVLNRF